MLDQFFVTSPTPSILVLPISYNLLIVLISVAVAICSAVLGMYTVGISQHNRSSLLTQQIAIFGGSCSLGVGIWAMHFIGLLSMDFCAEVRYQLDTTLLSVLPAFFASTIALHLLAKKNPTLTQLVIGGVLIGAGIGTMHYVGMSAIQTAPLLRYDPTWFFLSLMIAVSLAVLAVWVRFDLVNKGRISAKQSIWVSGITLGLAISGMHYASMYGARFIGKPSNIDYHTIEHHLELALIIACAALIVGIVILSGIALYRSRLMKQELSDREQQYRTLIANIPGVAYRCEAVGDWFMIFASDAITQVTGHDKRRFIRRDLSIISIIHPDDIQRVRQTVNDALAAHRSYVVEYRIIHANGGERWISESASGVYNEKHQPIWIDGVMIDITESKLRAAEHEGIVFAMRQALAVAEFDMNGYLLDANENFLTMMGYTLEELRHRHHRMLCHPGEAESQGYLDFWQALNDGHFQSREFCRLAKDAREVWIQAAYNPILNSDGKPWKVVKLAIDLSLRKEMERDLIDARDRAEQASAAKGMFLANMSHEIRTPMNAIIGFTDVLLQSELSNTQRSQLNTVSHAAKSLLGLLNDILDTAKLERGAVELDPDDFSLYDMCNNLISTYALQANNKGIALHLQYDDATPPSIHGDALRIRQIITNLLGNAIKFTEKGSVTLSVKHQPDYFEFAITDTGIGIPEERLERIFSPFTQADASMARRFGGTGLGTTIAHQLITLMNGTIDVTSEMGKGSCFTIRLPLPVAKQGASWHQVEKTHLPCLGILAVDDVPENLELLSLLLSKDGHQVTKARNGKEAIAQYQKGNFDIILMDVQMPEMDGLTATQHIRKWETSIGREGIPIIALTASVLPKDRQDAINAGMNGFATKPIDFPLLQKEIAKVLSLLPNDKSADSTALSPSASNTIQVIDWDSATVRWGDRQLLIKMIHKFLADYSGYSQKILAAAPEDQPALAHKIKGVATNLGLQVVGNIAGEIEHGKLKVADGVLQLEEAMQMVQNIVPAPEMESVSAITPQIDVKACQESLLALKAACKKATIDDAALSQLQSQLPESALRTVTEFLDCFEFDEAEAEIDKLLATCLKAIQ